MDVSGDPKDFFPLYASLDKDGILYKSVSGVIDSLKNDKLVGIRVRQKQIPNYYTKKHDINAVYKVDLPGYFRLIYGLMSVHGERKALIMDLFDHKKYNRRFGY